MSDEQEQKHSTAAYDAIRARLAARNAIFVQEELVEELTGTEVPDPEQLSSSTRGFLWFIAFIMIVMGIAGFFANPIGGLAMIAFFCWLWNYMVAAAKEINASADGAGNMYRLQRVGRSQRAAEIAREQRKGIETLVEGENPYELLQNLDDPEYVRTLKEALRRDERGWTMSN